LRLINARIGVQLGIGISVILIMVVCLGVIAWFDTGRMYQETQGLYDHTLQVRRALGELKADILNMHLDMNNLDQAENEQAIAAVIQNLDIYQANAFNPTLPSDTL
jgi:hypothetical protein